MSYKMGRLLQIISNELCIHTNWADTCALRACLLQLGSRTFHKVFTRPCICSSIVSSCPVNPVS